MTTVIGYEKAKNLMKQLDWKMRVTMEGENLQRVELYHPKRTTVYLVRKDSFKKLCPECRVVGRGEDDLTAILCYDHDGSDENLILSGGVDMYAGNGLSEERRNPVMFTLEIRSQEGEIWFLRAFPVGRVKIVVEEITSARDFWSGGWTMVVRPYNDETDREKIGDLGFLEEKR